MADTRELALEAVKWVQVTYKNKKPLVTTLEEGLKDESRQTTNFPDFFGYCPKQVKVGDTSEEEKKDGLTIIEGEFEMGSQYHFYMETLSAVCRQVIDIACSIFRFFLKMYPLLARACAADSS